MRFFGILRDSSAFSKIFFEIWTENLKESWRIFDLELRFFEILWDSQRFFGIPRDSSGLSKIFFEVRTENLQESLRIFNLELRILNSGLRFFWILRDSLGFLATAGGGNVAEQRIRPFKWRKYLENE